MGRYILVFMLLAFTLSSSASAAMLCCWDKAPDSNIEQMADDTTDMPCHDTGDSDKAPIDCCSDMSVCKTPVIYGSDSISTNVYSTLAMVQPVDENRFVSNLAMPPTPPPKVYL